MSDKLNEIAKGSFLRVNEEGKAYWGQPEGGGGGVTTLHIDVTAVNFETMEATFTADKTPKEMEQAAVTGPVWCVVTFAAGLMAEEAISFGVPPAWGGGFAAFGETVNKVHGDNGNNTYGYVVKEVPHDRWSFDVSQFGG